MELLVLGSTPYKRTTPLLAVPGIRAHGRLCLKSRFAQVIEARFSAEVWSCPS